MHTTEEGLVASLSTVEGDRSYYYFDRDGYVRMCVMFALQGILEEICVMWIIWEGVHYKKICYCLSITI